MRVIITIIIVVCALLSTTHAQAANGFMSPISGNLASQVHYAMGSLYPNTIHPIQRLDTVVTVQRGQRVYAMGAGMVQRVGETEVSIWHQAGDARGITVVYKNILPTQQMHVGVPVNSNTVLGITATNDLMLYSYKGRDNLYDLCHTSTGEHCVNARARSEYIDVVSGLNPTNR